MTKIRTCTENDDSWLVPDDVIIYSGDSDDDLIPGKAPEIDPDDKEPDVETITISESDASPVKPVVPKKKIRLDRKPIPEPKKADQGSILENLFLP